MSKAKNKLSGELLIDDFSENSHRVRRNLLIFSFIGIFYKLSGAKVSEKGISLYGLEFDKIDESFISIGLYCVIFYHLYHFSLIAIAHWQYLRIRVTKLSNKCPTSTFFAIGEEDHRYDPKNSSLHAWYIEALPSLNSQFDDAYKKIEELLKIYEIEKNKQGVGTEEIQKCYAHLCSIDQNLKELLSTRLIKSLKNFDNSLRCYRGVDLTRWIMIEIALPVLMGIYALYLLP